MGKTIKKIKQKVENLKKKTKGKVRGLTRRRLSEEDKRRYYLNNSSESNVSSFSNVESINSNRNNSSVKSTESNFFGLPNGYYNYNIPTPTKNSKNNESNKNSPFQRVPGKLTPLKLKSNNSPNINEANFTEVKRISTRRIRKNKPKRVPAAKASNKSKTQKATAVARKKKAEAGGRADKKPNMAKTLASGGLAVRGYGLARR